MKNYLLLVFMFFCSVQIVFSQQKRKLDIYLKDGTIITGSLVTQTKEGSVIVQVNDTFNMCIPLDDIQKSPHYNSSNLDSLKRVTDFSSYFKISSTNLEHPYPPFDFESIDTTREFIYTAIQIVYGKVTIPEEKLIGVNDYIIFNDSIQVKLEKLVGYNSTDGGLRILIPHYKTGLVAFANDHNKNPTFIKRITTGKIDIFEVKLYQSNMNNMGSTNYGGKVAYSYYRIGGTNDVLEFNNEKIVKYLSQFSFMAEIIKRKSNDSRALIQYFNNFKD